jgi:hypothetical protein
MQMIQDVVDERTMKFEEESYVNKMDVANARLIYQFLCIGVREYTSFLYTLMDCVYE